MGGIQGVKVYHAFRLLKILAMGTSVVKTPHIQCRGHKFDPWSGKILHVMWYGQNFFKNKIKYLSSPVKFLGVNVGGEG